MKKYRCNFRKRSSRFSNGKSRWKMMQYRTGKKERPKIVYEWFMYEPTQSRIRFLGDITSEVKRLNPVSSPILGMIIQ